MSGRKNFESGRNWEKDNNEVVTTSRYEFLVDYWSVLHISSEVGKVNEIESIGAFAFVSLKNFICRYHVCSIVRLISFLLVKYENELLCIQ